MTIFIRTHMQDLKEVTNFLHYESYRRQRCPQGNQINGDSSPLEEKPEILHENGVVSESNI